MATDKNILAKGVKYLSGALPLLFLGPIIINSAFKNQESPLYPYVLGLGIGGTVADLVMGLTSDVKYPTAITYAGVGLMAVSIPILSGRKKMVQESVDIYNAGLKEQNKTLGDNFELNIVNNSNGVGLRINF